MAIESVTYGVRNDEPMAIAHYEDGRIPAQQFKDDGRWHKLPPADASTNSRACDETTFRTQIPQAGTSRNCLR